MTPENHEHDDRRIGAPGRLSASQRDSPRRGKQRGGPISGMKTLITAASLATTVAGWAMFAQQDAISASQAMPTATEVSALIATPITAATVEATATPVAQATATLQQAQATATTPEATATTPDASATTPTAAATATATTPPTATTTARATATTATAKATATPKAAVATTRSSR